MYLSGDAGGRPFERLRVRVLLLSRRSHEGRDGNERADHGQEAFVRRPGAAQGGPQGPFGVPIRAANQQHAHAPDRAHVKPGQRRRLLRAVVPAAAALLRPGAGADEAHDALDPAAGAAQRPGPHVRADDHPVPRRPEGPHPPEPRSAAQHDIEAHHQPGGAQRPGGADRRAGAAGRPARGQRARRSAGQRPNAAPATTGHLQVHAHHAQPASARDRSPARARAAGGAHPGPGASHHHHAGRRDPAAAEADAG